MFQIFPIFFLPDLQEHTEQTDPVDLLPETIHQSTESPTLPPTLSMVELFNKRRQKLMQRKLRIAELSNSILENPQESVSREPIKVSFPLCPLLSHELLRSFRPDIVTISQLLVQCTYRLGKINFRLFFFARVSLNSLFSR